MAEVIFVGVSVPFLLIFAAVMALHLWRELGRPGRVLVPAAGSWIRRRSPAVFHDVAAWRAIVATMRNVGIGRSMWRPLVLPAVRKARAWSNAPRRALSSRTRRAGHGISPQGAESSNTGPWGLSCLWGRLLVVLLGVSGVVVLVSMGGVGLLGLVAGLGGVYIVVAHAAVNVPEAPQGGEGWSGAPIGGRGVPDSTSNTVRNSPGGEFSPVQGDRS